MTLVQSDRAIISVDKIFGLLTAVYYVVFTLVPDSHSLMVLYPFVSFWQIGLTIPIVWFLLLLWGGKIEKLGNGWDWGILVMVIGLIASTIFARFHPQALWYSWAALSGLASIYVLRVYLDNARLRYEILVKQGYLNLAFIVVSLTLWTTETLLPELNRIAKLKSQGINLQFDFSVLELRNWAPIGHQNYVAGYLLLAISLSIGLSIVEKTWRRWLWMASVILGLIDLYTTSSKGGWLGAIAALAIGLIFLLILSSFSRLKLILGGLLGLGVICTILLTNNRFYSFLTNIIAGRGASELVFRQINAVLGWQMGMSQPLTGVGLGGVPLLYQEYRPVWAGRHSELVFQLHGTLVQLWAEMGIWGVIIVLCAIALWMRSIVQLFKNNSKLANSDYLLCCFLCFGFLAYGVTSLTDYQLDNISIFGTLIIFLACLTSALSNNSTQLSIKNQRYFSLTGWSITIAVIIWLIPVHRAWQFSSEGFQALNRQDNDTFVAKLTEANRLAPWESYYSYQLGWNLGEMARATGDKQQLQQAIYWFKKAIEVSPYQEFGHSNLGWLLLNVDPPQATQAFAKSARLIPAKHGVFYGLGLSLLAQNKVDLAVKALTLEALREPLLITSPIWHSPNLRSIYPRLLDNLETKYNRWLEKDPDNVYLHLCRGSFYWWVGNFVAAEQDWKHSGSELHRLMLNINSDSQLQQKLHTLPTSATKTLITAWFDRTQRTKLLTKAWLEKTQTEIPSPILSKLVSSMDKSDSFGEWLKYNVPVFPHRFERQGFGVVSRHIDGVIPSDYFIVIDNPVIATWFDNLFPANEYDVDLDNKLQPLRTSFLTQLTAKETDEIFK
jgi:tetratricopeptide (TPR) repeat protein